MTTTTKSQNSILLKTKGGLIFGYAIRKSALKASLVPMFTFMSLFTIMVAAMTEVAFEVRFLIIAINFAILTIGNLMTSKKEGMTNSELLCMINTIALLIATIAYII